jgi:hypothetical protein
MQNLCHRELVAGMRQREVSEGIMRYRDEPEKRKDHQKETNLPHDVNHASPHALCLPFLYFTFM